MNKQEYLLLRILIVILYAIQHVITLNLNFEFLTNNPIFVSMSI
jgi:hypothetical protein